MLRLIFVILVIIPATLWHGARMIWAVLRKSPKASCVCVDAPRSWARIILRASASDVVFEKLEVIDPDRPQVLVANHLSWYDVLALVAYLPGRCLFVAKKELTAVPIFGRALVGCGHIFIDRKDRTRAVESLGEARELLERESPTIIVFPEGTRSQTGELQPFKKGAFVLAIQAGVDVVPAAISGSREIMRKGTFFVRPGTVHIRFGEPISIEGLKVEDRNELTEQAWEAVRRLQATEAR